MKIKSDFQNTFKPVTFSITVESEDELIALWQAFSLSKSSLQTALENDGFVANQKFNVAKTLSSQGFQHISAVCRGLGLDAYNV